MLNAQFNAVVVCDDVRKEMSGKDIIIGAYGSEIQVHSLPYQMNVAFWMEMTSKRSGPCNFFFRIQPPNTDHKVEFKLAIDITNHKIPVAIFTPQIPIGIDREGSLKLYVKGTETEKYELIKTREIKYVPFQLPSAPTKQTNLSPTS